MNLWGRVYRQAKALGSGTYRIRPPGETLRDYWRFAPLMGITRIANITGLDNIGLPVYACMRPNSRSLSVSQGKGLDSDSAKASAFMESVEHWHGERVELAGRNESYSSLHRENEGGVVDVFALPLAKGARPQAHLPLWWNSGWDILTNRPIWVPFETVSTNFVSGIGRSTFFASSNGLASGNHLLEAVLHGLLEVIERDSHARWSSKSDEEVRATSIDLATVDDPVCLGVLELLERAKVHARVFDMTCDLGIPAYFCMLHEHHDQWRPLGAASGLGCSVSPEIALLRALTESVQSRTTMIAGSRDDMFYRAYSEFVSVRGSKAIDNVAEQTPGRMSFSARKSLATTTFDGDIAILCDALRRGGVENVIAVDLTKSAIGIPVVKLIVPGMENRAHVRAEMLRSRPVGATP